MLDRRQRGRRVVELRAGGHDVHALTVAVEDDGGAELLVLARATVELARDPPRKCDRIALDGDVDVEALLAEEDVPHGAADEIDAFHALARRGNRAEGPLEARKRPQLGRDRLPRLVRGLRRLVERAQDVSPGDHAGDRFPVDDRDPALRRVGKQLLELGQRRIGACLQRAAAHDPLDRRVGQAVPDRPVEVLSGDRADELPVLRYEHAALVVALAERHRVGDGVARRDHASRLRHHVPRAQRLLDGRRQRREDPPLGIGE